MAKDKYDAERRDTGARTDKDPDGNELRVRFHQGGRELAHKFQGAVGEAQPERAGCAWS